MQSDKHASPEPAFFFLLVFKEHHPLSFGSRGVDVCGNLLRCSLWYLTSPV
ncbi:hypothetical protein CIH91_002580 [Salmonella enterica]|uniref:Uncharacterized protein n=1 Tax=Salmonella enterica TaxID=28901 RepID=A0A744NMT8_SALER|nr:hypothetical protein [Salmonella enterica subsp. enterica]EDQ0218031.1 hypothetical protein [Salmonella enterica subsp. enterica serovar Gaminara]EDQ1016595.1 hypothetical protein [Salmonella enterica subsp. houtenae serovar 50:z4,z23:-]EDQ1075700.1 hypothetical protein [Salmonella enterica]EDR6015906.1 hypothetical protein [Salmonella enterica subsp. enterica serovar Javiana]EDS6373903.1 hypothetical protein [Salmonella enterica subsp. diarizonae]EDT0849294.1 hypothetical protein [Salmone